MKCLPCWNADLFYPGNAHRYFLKQKPADTGFLVPRGDLDSRPRAYESPSHYVQESGSRYGKALPKSLLFPVYGGVLR
jgi:hypothetical protein